MIVPYRSVFRSLKYLPDNSLLVVHGTADDNVHLTLSMLLSRVLIEHGILFRQMVSYVIILLQIRIFLYFRFILMSTMLSLEFSLTFTQPWRTSSPLVLGTTLFSAPLTLPTHSLIWTHDNTIISDTPYTLSDFNTCKTSDTLSRQYGHCETYSSQQ